MPTAPLREILMPMALEIRDPERVAVASIRGYWYQLLHTVRAWLRAGDDHLIIAEGNEDIDHVLLTTPITVLEEQIKLRKNNVTQGSKAVAETVLHYLSAFVDHSAKGRNFRGILRTNAEISDDDSTQIGKWLVGKRINLKEFRRELRTLVRADGETRLAAYKALKSAADLRAFINCVEWAPRAGNPAEIEAEIMALLRARAPEAPRDAASNTMMVRMLKTLTDDDLERRVLRRIDVDVLLNDSILDALVRSGAADHARQWRVALWARSQLPAVAVAMFVDDERQFEHAVEFAHRHDEVRGKTRSEEEILRDLAESVDFLAYVSFRGQKGKHRVRDCLRDVIRQSRHRHLPVEVWLPMNAPNWTDSLVATHWPVPSRVAPHQRPSVFLRLGQIVGEAIADDPPKREILRALGSKLRWVRRVDDGEYFTSGHPMDAAD